MSFTTSTGHFDQLILGATFSLHGFPAPSRRRFLALPCGVIAGYPMQTVFRFSRCGAGSGNKKSPHNNRNLTIPSGMALVRVRYVAIRKSKTCSGAMKAPVGLLSDRTVLRSKMEGPRPDKFTLTRLDFCGNLSQQFNITYLLRVPARLPKEPEQVFDFLIAT